MNLHGKSCAVLVVAFALGGAACEASSSSSGTASAATGSSMATGGFGAGGFGAGGGGEATASSGASGGMMATPCGSALEPVPAACPPQCSGGCDGGLCLVLCSTEASCNTVIQCPEHMHCQVTCTGANSCRYQVRCDDDYRCHVTCNGEFACQGLELQCGERSDCAMTCSVPTGACENATITCGSGKCESLCFGNEQPEHVCGDACQCSPCSN